MKDLFSLIIYGIYSMLALILIALFVNLVITAY